MNHERHFTLEEANAALEWLQPCIAQLRSARDRLGDRDAHAAMTDAAPTNGGGDHGRTIGKGFLEVRRLLGVIAEAGIVLRDLDRGLIDFPAMRDGREVYLCWQEGEDEVAHWHELDTGFSGREAI